MRKIVVGITGASGGIYGLRLLEILQQIPDIEVHVVISEHGWQVLEYECGTTPETLQPFNCIIHDVKNIGASIASGSFQTEAMVVVPCSMRTIGNIANGIADNLLSRTADVMLKEGRKLIVVPRETPLSAIHLENMLKLARLGVRIVPACPGFYHRPQDLQSVIDMMVGKICDSLGVDHQLFTRWQGE